MKKIIKAITSVALSGCMLMPIVAFADVEPASFTDAEIKLADANRTKAVSYIGNDSMFMGDFDNNGSLTASDARSILRYTAQLESKPSDGDFDYRCDMNADKKITPADARAVLRIVSKLDSSDITYLNAFNAILNSVKPDNQKVRTSYRSVVQSKSYDNKEVSSKFKTEMNKLIDKLALLQGIAISKEDIDDLRKISLDTELTAIDHNSEDDYIIPDWSNGGRYVSACNIKFPLGAESKTASEIDMSQVEKIEYNPNDNGKFVCETRYVDNNTGKYGVYYEADVSCASITVYLKNETVVDVPEDKTLLEHGKLFNIRNLDNNTEFSGVDGDFKDFGDITGKLDSVKYHGSYVKVYFNNDASSSSYGKAVYVDYNLNYDINVYSHFLMDVDLNKLVNENWDGGILPKLHLNDYFVLTTVFRDRTQFYFEQNK